MSWRYYGDPRPDIQRLINPVGARVLDVGCAEGALAAALRQAGTDYLAGVEMNPAAAEIAREHLDKVVVGDVYELTLPFRAREFDYLNYADVLEHAADPDAVLAKLLPFLREDGRVVVSVPNMRFYTVLLRLVFDRWSYTDSGIRDRTHLRIFTRRSLERMLGKHGLVIERMERNYRLFEDQSTIGRAGALATQLVRRTLAPWFFPDLMAFQHIAVARRRAASR